MERGSVRGAWRTARSILKTLRQERRHVWCARMLRRFSLPATVHDEASCRVWQRRFYDMNIWSEKKQLEKLDYMHNNPVERRLVGSPGDWPWSSWRDYFLEDESLITMDRWNEKTDASRFARTQTRKCANLRHPPLVPVCYPAVLHGPFWYCRGRTSGVAIGASLAAGPEGWVLLPVKGQFSSVE